MKQYTLKPAISKKFNIKELLDSLPYNKRNKAREELISLMNISESTFERIIYATQGDKQEITATNLIKVANYFNVTAESILNKEEEIKIGNIEFAR